MFINISSSSFKPSNSRRTNNTINFLHRRRQTQKHISSYYTNGQIIISWFNNGNFHRPGTNGPAFIVYFNNGQIEREAWYKNGKRHRSSGPSSIEYFNNGQIEQKNWYKHGKLHRSNDAPAVIKYYENGQIRSKAWYTDGMRQATWHTKNGGATLTRGHEVNTTNGVFNSRM